MTEKQFRKIASHLDGSKFKDLAEATVDIDCRNLDGTKIVGAARDNLIESMSLDYAVGSRYTKNKYLAIGFISGAILVVGVLFTKKKVSKKVSKKA